MNLQVLKKSPKGACLLTDNNGIEFWVKPNCVREDGTFTPSVEKEYGQLKESFDAAKAFRNKFANPKFWSSPHKPGSFRIYMGDKFISGSCTEKSPSGHYERHRWCKGESYYSCFVFDSLDLLPQDLNELLQVFRGKLLEAAEGKHVFGANISILVKRDERWAMIGEI